MKKWILIFVGLFLIASTQLLAQAQKVYWISTGTAKIFRANPDGSDIERLVYGTYQPMGLALAKNIGKIYWTRPFQGKIMRANLDGTGVEEISSTSMFNQVWAIDVDEDGGKIYYSWYLQGKILRANLDGSGEEVIYEGRKIGPYIERILDIELDLTSGKMYWANNNNESITAALIRANLDGSNVEVLWESTDFTYQWGFDIDFAEGKIFWGSRPVNGTDIHSANLDGQIEYFSIIFLYNHSLGILK
ncbi:MAG: hypothetical protein ISS16_02190 [Ignavibacteria bacterium]|nr:hypothetical protein [Ignavibacteria bacterium]